MFDKKLDGVKVAVLATDGFEYSELTQPKLALEEAGAQALIVSAEKGRIKGWSGTDWGDSVAVDLALSDATNVDFDALLIPGGVMSPDKLRTDQQALRFVNSFVESGKPIAAICHGPQVLIETGCVRDRKMTSWPSLKTDLKNAGATWVDQDVVCDRGLVTSRKPEDIPAFNKKMIEEFAEGIHPEQRSQRTTKNRSELENFY